MKLLVVISLFFTSTFALEFNTEWNDSFEKSIKMTCSEEETICTETCENETSCTFEEKTCRDCIGTSVYMTHLFKTMGQVYRNNGVQSTTDELVELLSSGKFASITSKSIYNHVDKFDSPRLRARFQSLCSNDTQYPIVLLNMNSSNKILGDVRYVVCGSEVFEMENNPDVLIKESLSTGNELY